MRNIIVFISLIFILVGYSCNKHDKSHLDSNIEDASNCSIKRTISDTFVLIGSSDNPYNTIGYNYILKINEMVEKINEGDLESDSLIGQYILDSFENDYSLSDIEISKYQTFLSSHDFTLANIILFESSIISEGNASIDMLKSISYIKYSLYYASLAQGGGGVAAFDACVDNCIRSHLSQIFDDGNVVDQAAFIAGCPISFAWIVASCTYECS